MTLPFPQSVLSQHIIALGKTRSGKSSKLRLIVEQLLEREEPVCIIDPKGDWWGLKSSADGKHAGYPVVIFGGEHADVPLNPRAGAAVAELIATGNRPSLIDLGGWMVSERTQFFIDFASTWFKVARGHRKLVIDEVHNFAPKGKILDPQAGRMLHWANRLASEAAGKGTILVAASQRPQKVHNDFLTSCETLIACKVIHKSDRDAIKDWIDGCADPEMGRKVLTELASMERPEAWVWSPEAGFGPKRITFPMYSTYDSFKPQEAQAAKLKGWAEVDLAEVRTKLEAVVAEAAANDPAELKKRIRELEAQIKGIGGLRPEETRAAQDTGYRRGIEDGREEGLKAARGAQRTLLSSLRIDLEGELQTFGNALWKLLESKRPIEPVMTMHPTPTALRPATRQALEQVASAAARQVSARLKPGINRGENGAGEKLPRAERALLTVLAQHRSGRTRVQLAVLSGYSIKSSSFANALGALRSAGYATKSEPIRATDEGVAALGDYEPLPTGPDLIVHWFGQLPKAERALLEVCVRHHGRAISKEELAEQAGYSVTSSSFANALGKLRTLELVERGADIRANADLFS